MNTYHFGTDKWQQATMEILASHQSDIRELLGAGETFVLVTEPRRLVTTLGNMRLAALLNINGIPANPHTMPIREEQP